MIALVLRECAFLLLGIGVSIVASLFGNAGRNFAALVAAILIPIAFCLTRAAFVRHPPPALSRLRYRGFQLAIGFALIFLLVFEMAVAMLAGSADIPIGVWAVVAGFGLGNLLLFGIAHHLGGLLDRST